MARLPIVGSDNGTWGTILNEYLSVGHNGDGTHKTIPVSEGGTGGTNAAAARSNLGAISSSDAQALIDTHSSDTTSVHGIADTANLETTAGAQAKVDTHVNDTSAAHAASAISFTPAGTISATNVQAAIEEVATEAGGSIVLSDNNPQALADTAAPGVSTQISRSDHVHPNTGLATDAELTAHTGATAAHGATGAVVGTTNTQTLTNKTLTSPVINTPTGIVKGDVGLGNVDNTSDANKPVSTATQAALDLKLDKAGGTMTGALTLAADPTANLEAATKQYVDNNVGGGGSGGASFVGVSAYKSADQALTTATGTAISFDIERFDTDGFHDNATNNTRFTVPSGRGGKYLVEATVQWAGNATGLRSSWIRVNGSDVRNLDSRSASTASTIFQSGSVVLNLSSGDYVELIGYQDSGGSLNALSGVFRTSLSLVLLDTSVGTAGFVGARAYRSAALSIATGTTVALAFDAESYDSNGFHDNATNNTRFTIPAGKGGKYLVQGQASWVANSTGERYIDVRKNGTSVAAKWFPAGTEVNATSFSIATTVDCVSGDYIEISVHQTSGGSLALNPGTSQVFGEVYWLEGLQAQIGVKKAGTLIGTRQSINFIEGSNVTLTVADDSANGEVDVTIAAGGGSSGGASFVGVRAKRDEAQSIPDNVTTYIQLTSEDFDTDGFHDNATNNTRLTIPSGRGGKYLLSVKAVFAANGTGIRYINVVKNGDTTNGKYELSYIAPASASNNTILNGTVVIDLAAGDYIEFGVWQTSGGALNVSASWASMVMLDTSVGTAGFVGAKGYRATTAQSLTSAATTAIQLNAESFDSNGFHDNVTNNTRITVPAGKGGKYLLVGQIEFSANATGYRFAYIRKNGSTTMAEHQVVNAGASAVVAIPVSTMVDLVAGDYVELMANHDAGVAINANVGEGITFLSAYWLEGLQAQTAVKKNGTLVATRGGLDLIEGTGISLTVADDSANGEVDVTVDTRFVGVSVYLATSSQSATNATTTPVAFNAEAYDTDGFHDNVTNNTRLTVPAGKAGKYMILGQIRWAANTTGLRSVSIGYNGSQVAVDERQALSTSAVMRHQVSKLLNMSVGDYVELRGYQESGGALNINPNDSETWFTMYRIGI